MFLSICKVVCLLLVFMQLSNIPIMFHLESVTKIPFSLLAPHMISNTAEETMTQKAVKLLLLEKELFP